MLRQSRVHLPLLTCLLLGAAPIFAQGKAKPVFKDGQAQVVDAFKKSKDWIQHDLWVETEFDSDQDGRPDRVHVDVTRQKQTESQGLKVAVIYETSPYFSGTSSSDRRYFWDPAQELGVEQRLHEEPPPIPHQSRRPLMSSSLIGTWVPRGFAVVHSASPGTGLSQGCPTVGGENEALAPKAVIDWLNGRALGYTSPDGDELVEAFWSTGKVGMTGTSYNGTLPLAAATTGVEGLEAIIPVSPNTSYYHYYRSNGLVRHPGGWMGEDIDVLYNFINSGDPDGRENCDCIVRDEVMRVHQDRISGDYNDFWAGRDYLNQLDDLRCAVLMAHGFNDWNVMPAHSVRIYEAVKAKGVPHQAFFHQGGHGGPPPMERMNRWFSRYLYGVKNKVEQDPKAWIVREGDKRSQPTAYADYPNPDAEVVALYLGEGGGKMGELVAKPRADQGQESLVDDASKPGDELAAARTSKHRLLYATSELKAPVHLSGTARINLRVASDRETANLSVWLVSLPWSDKGSINDNLITRGWADPQNRNSLTESSPLVPGEYVDLSFDLEPDDQIIPKGQRIGLMIFSSDRDFTLWPEAGTVLSVDLDGTSLELPVVGGSAALNKAVRKR